MKRLVLLVAESLISSIYQAGGSVARSLRIKLLGVLFAIAMTSQSFGTPIQWPGNGHYYEAIAVGTPITWDAAEAASEARGGYLACITSSAENAFIFGLVDSPQYWHLATTGNNEGPWLGGYQLLPAPAPSANWTWISGETWSYTNWLPPGPDDFGGEQDKLDFKGPGTSRTSGWNDQANNDAIGVPIAYVVESNTPEPSTFALLGIGAASVLAYGWWKRRKTA